MGGKQNNRKSGTTVKVRGIEQETSSLEGALKTAERCCKERPTPSISSTTTCICGHWKAHHNSREGEECVWCRCKYFKEVDKEND